MERSMTFSRPLARLRPVLLAAFAIGLMQTPGPVGATPPSPTAPNIVLIMTDDEDVKIHEFMPKTKALLADRGTTFTNFFVTYPWCCPSRATILRGQYAHNTKIVGNEPPWGGFEQFRALGLEESTVATWLQAGGYRTAMVGKYLNRYAPEKDGVPPGWDEWYVGGMAHASYHYTLNENGRIVAYGDRPEDYLNDVLTGKAVDVIRRSSAAGEPFFVYVLPYTPHSPSVAAPRHAGMFADAELPRTPAVDEADLSDKPAFIRSLLPFDAERTAYLEDEYRRRLRSLQAIDDMVASIVGALDAAGVLDDTYVMYSSDNGFHIGEHGLPAGKDFPYEEDIRVPMTVRGPGVPEARTIEALVLNNDFAPTFAEIAGIEPASFVDGRSFLPLLRNPERAWRQSFLIQRRVFEAHYLELAERSGMTAELIDRSAYYDAIRTADWTYVEYATGERELYDLARDPHQLDNVADTADPVLIAALSKRVAALARCAAAECRRIENLPAGAAEPPLLAKPQPDAMVIPAAATK
jgi:arylsulfatase A-like enzyme